MISIRMRGVSVEYDVLTVRDHNFKRRLLSGLGTRRVRGRRSVVKGLNDVSLTITAGSRVAVLGANGSGKSTFLRVIGGSLPPTRGDVEVRGRLLSLLGGSGAGLDPESTGYENMMLIGLTLGLSRAQMNERIDEMAEFSGLGDRLATPISTYSSGMQARLRFSVLTTLRPEILIMDEGVATADAEFTSRAGDRLQEFLGSAGILVMSSHGAGPGSLCDSAIWLHQGAVMAYGPFAEVKAAYSLAMTGSAESPAPVEWMG